MGAAAPSAGPVTSTSGATRIVVLDHCVEREELLNDEFASLSLSICALVPQLLVLGVGNAVCPMQLHVLSECLPSIVRLDDMFLFPPHCPFIDPASCIA
jgi:hypothetical protein